MNPLNPQHVPVMTVRAPSRKVKIRALTCGLALVACDVMAITLAGLSFSGLSVWSGLSLDAAYDYTAVAAFIAASLVVLRLAALRHYASRLPMLRELRELFGALVLGCGCHLILLTMRGGTREIVPAALLWLCAAFLVPLCRLACKLVLMKVRVWQRDLYVIGGGALALDAATAVEAEPLMGLELRGFIADNGSGLPRDATVLPISPLDARSLDGAFVMVALDSTDTSLRNAWLRALSLTSANVVLVANVPGMPLHGTRSTYVKTHELLLLQIRDNLNRWHIRFFKRCLDLFGAIGISMLLSPVLLYLAWQVRKDGGNAIYGHPRIGRHAQSFYCYKFRSMVPDAGARLAELLERDADARREWERDFKLKDDPRVTRIGSFLRRTSLDELPQLWNVIRGDMSLVGPRPIVQAELERYADDASYYLMARPGMTGLWQVSGRNETDYPTRVYLDAWYVRNWSLWYDIAILFMTVRTVLKRDGAY
jgi:UDP-galactose-lipid carrier transferase